MTKFYTLGIDPGKKSGVFALDESGCRVGSGTFVRSDYEGRRDFVKAVVRKCVSSECDLIVWREKWQAGGQRFGPSVSAGLGMSWGQWYEVIKQETGGIPENRIMSVYPSAWRSSVLQTGRDWKKLASIYAWERWGMSDMGEDMLSAAMIAAHGFKSDESSETSKSKPGWHKHIP